MKITKRFISGIQLFFAAVTLFSCNLEDFNLNKLADPVIVPEVFAPLAYGTFKVSDLAPAPAPTANAQIPAGGFNLDPVIISKSGTSFSSAAIDSVYLITHFTNATPCDMEFELSFLSSSNGPPIGKIHNSGKIPAYRPDFNIIPFFGLDRTDQDDLQNATYIKLNFKLFPSDTGNITYDAVKSKLFTVKISFYAPVNLQKL